MCNRFGGGGGEWSATSQKNPTSTAKSLADNTFPLLDTHDMPDPTVVADTPDPIVAPDNALESE